MSPNLVIVGTVALDDVTTPFGTVNRALGGSAFYGAIAGSYWTSVGIVAVVGEDYPETGLNLLASRGIDARGLERSSEKTFAWTGEYSYDLNTAITRDTRLNCLLSFDPKVALHYPRPETLFLANVDPEIQGRILDQLSDRPRLVALDTMNYWIESKKEALLKVLRRTDLLTINESEARMLTGEFNLVRAADAIRKMGPKIIVLKKGEHGALVFYEGGIFASPAMPLEVVKDPTGAGDSFAGGLLGYLTRHAKLSPEFLRQAAIVGSTMASFCVSDFGVAGTKELTMDQISRRTGEFLDLTAFPRIDIGDRRL